MGLDPFYFFFSRVALSARGKGKKKRESCQVPGGAEKGVELEEKWSAGVCGQNRNR